MRLIFGFLRYIVEEDKKQIVLSIICFLFPLVDSLNLVNVGDSGTNACWCCDGYLTTYYNFVFNGEVFCSIEETVTEYDENLFLSSTLSDESLAHLVKKYKRDLHYELIAVAWHPDRAFKWCFDINFSFL